MARRKNAITEAFARIEDEEEVEGLSTDEIEASEDDDAEEFLEDSDAGEYTDEDVQEEVERMSSEQRRAVERSRTHGRASTKGRRQGRQTAAKSLAKARTPVREREVEWQPANTLEAPPARPGMEQRWIRFQLGDKNDPRNWSRKTRERWAPRRLETVPEQYVPPTLSHGQLGEVVGVADLILCERPIEVGRARKKYFRAKTQRQLAAAERRHADKVSNSDNPIRVTSKRDLSRGTGHRRRVQAQDDE